MNKTREISEFDVLEATIPFLAKRKVLPVSFSIARGQGIDYENGKSRILEKFMSFSFTPEF